MASDRGHHSQATARVDAAGVTGRDRDEAIEELLELATGDVSGLTESIYLTVENSADGVVELLQYKDGEPEPMLRLSFTPTDAREVEQVSAKTYFERVAEEVQQSGASGWRAIKESYGL